MKTYSISSDSSSDDEALIVIKKKNNPHIANYKDPNCYTNLLEQDWQQCEFCDEFFANRYALIRHNVSHIIIPLIKQTLHQCKECYHHFATDLDLNTHISKHHYKITIKPLNQEKVLQSIITNQVSVSCQDDIKEILANHDNYMKKIAAANNIKYISRTGYEVNENTHNFSNLAQTAIENDVPNQNVTYLNVSNLKIETQIKTESSDILNNGNVSNNVQPMNYDDLRNEVKEEIPTKYERSSSPTDEEKESIRHRLLFEEDVEDTLFKDLSADCQVNIETLCKEITLDFDDAPFEEVETLDPDLNATDNFKHGTNNVENGIKVSTIGTNGFNEEIYNFVDVTKSFGNVVTNNLATETVVIENRINHFENNSNSEHEINNFENGTIHFYNGTESFNNINENNTNNASSKEIIDLDYYGQSVHYDVLIVPEISICRVCQKEFPNRLKLIQHEPVHFRTKKLHWRYPLCCFCDKYIIGNHITLRNHRNRVHPEQTDSDIQFKTHNCPKCKLKYYNFRKHLRNYHYPYYCQKCDQGFETLTNQTEHECGKPNLNFKSDFMFGKIPKVDDEAKTSVMHLCDLCFSFMKIYMQNRQNYEEVGVKSEFGVRQTCDKCNNLFFTVKLVKRKALVKAVEENKKVWDVGKPKVKPMSNMARLLKIQNRLKMMKKINKC